MVHLCTLTEGMDVKQEIEKFVRKKGIKVAMVLSSVGYLKQACISNMIKQELVYFDRPLGILVINGIVSCNGSKLSIGVSDENVQMHGGMIEEGCIVQSYVDIVLSEIDHCKIKDGVVL